MLKKVLASVLCFIIAISTTLTAFGAEFTPSVNAKPAPQIVTIGEEEYAGTFYSTNGKVLGYIKSSDIVITPYSDKDDVDDEIKNRLENSYNDIKNADKITDICPGLASTLPSSLRPEDVVVRDLFDITLVGEAKKNLKDGNYFEVTFELDADAESLVGVMQYVNGKWVLISEDCITRDGTTVTIRLTDEGTLAFLFDNGTIVPADTDSKDAPNSPETGDISLCYIVIVFETLVAGACVVVLVRRKMISEK